MEIKSKAKIRNDIILIAAVVLIAAIALVCLALFRKEGSVAVVTVDGELFGKYPLAVDTQVEIVTEHGRNLLVISNNCADVTEASCPDHICSEHRAISSEGETIVCLPNKVVISIE